MTFAAVTASGTQTGKIWYNDHNTQSSELVNAGDVSEIMGMSQDDLQAEYNSLEEIAADSRPFGNFDFSTEPKF